MAEVGLEDVSKVYGSAIAVRDLSLVVRDGEFVCLLGPSGSGKSTVLNIIAGLDAPTTGSIYIDGKRVNDLPPKDRGIAMVFQDYALYPHMTVRENLAFPLKAVKMSRRDLSKKVQEVAELLDIVELLDRLPKELSGGQKQRVALGRAVVRSPKVYLLDEPLSNLDARLRTHMRAELKRLHRRLRTTTIYVTHDQAEAMTLSDQVAILDNGILQQFDSPLRIYNEPESMFVASFVGTVPINLVDGVLGMKSGMPFFEAESFAYPISNFGAMLDRDDLPRRVVMGVRPEDVLVSNGGSGPCIEMSFEIAEHFGSDLYLHLKRGRTSLIARVAPEFETGDSLLRVTFNSKRLHFFDGGTGIRIT